jgi:hypothetical protein
MALVPIVPERKESVMSTPQVFFSGLTAMILVISAAALPQTAAAASNNNQGQSQGKGQGQSQGQGTGQVGQWSGSFLDSCTDVTVDKHGKLKATCRKENGTYNRSNLQAKKCPSYRAANRNGKLVCETDGGGSGNVGQWSGSYRDSCRDISTDANGTLTANCQGMDGNWRRSSLALRNCTSQRAGNNNGTLVCETGGSSGNVGQWSGSYRDSCRDISTDANGTLTANCQKMDGNWVRTSLTLRNCTSQRAGNRDGTLFCES